ncbi:HAD family hydrolase [Marinitoga arctica]
MYIFLDYDGTLIKTSEEIFQKYYFKSFLDYTNIDDVNVINHILEATKNLIKKNDKDLNNLEFFLKEMEKITGKNKDYWYNIFWDYYMNYFQNLKKIIEPNIKLINKIKNTNHKLIFASNPVFPEIAVHHRINFINMLPENFYYISYMENSHFCKPNPNYFIEILDKLNIGFEECVMIGDSEFDKASLKAGINFIHISEEDKWEKLFM